MQNQARQTVVRAIQQRGIEKRGQEEKNIRRFRGPPTPWLQFPVIVPKQAPQSSRWFSSVLSACGALGLSRDPGVNRFRRCERAPANSASADHLACPRNGFRLRRGGGRRIPADGDSELDRTNGVSRRVARLTRAPLAGRTDLALSPFVSIGPNLAAALLPL